MVEHRHEQPADVDGRVVDVAAGCGAKPATDQRAQVQVSRQAGGTCGQASMDGSGVMCFLKRVGGLPAARKTEGSRRAASAD